MVKAHKIELEKENPNYNSVNADANLEKKVEEVSAKFPEIMNLYDSLEWSKAFNPALESAKTDFGNIIAETKKSLAQVRKQIKEKNDKRKKNGNLTEGEWGDQMSWILKAEENDNADVVKAD